MLCCSGFDSHLLWSFGIGFALEKSLETSTKRGLRILKPSRPMSLSCELRPHHFCQFMSLAARLFALLNWCSSSSMNPATRGPTFSPCQISERLSLWTELIHLMKFTTYVAARAAASGFRFTTRPKWVGSRTINSLSVIEISNPKWSQLEVQRTGSDIQSSPAIQNLTKHVGTCCLSFGHAFLFAESDLPHYQIHHLKFIVPKCHKLLPESWPHRCHSLLVYHTENPARQAFVNQFFVLGPLGIDPAVD